MLGARAASRQKRNSFTSKWDTTQAGSANDSVDLENGNYPLKSDGSYNFKVFWGDGTTDIITSYNQAETKTIQGISVTMLNLQTYEPKV